METHRDLLISPRICSLRTITQCPQIKLIPGTLDLINSIDYHADEVVPASPPTQEMNIDCGPCPVVRLIYYGVMSIGLHN